MKLSKDAYGQELWAYLNKRESYEIVERDDGYIALSGGAPAYFAPYKRWSRRDNMALRFARGRILDIGSGAGRISLHLQKKGLKVTAIDNSPLAIKVCKMRGVKDARVMPIENIGKFRPSSFDTIVMFGNNFGLFGNFKKAKRLLKAMHRITSGNAVILAESRDPYATNDPAHLSYHRLNRKRGRMPGQLRIRVRFEQCTGEWLDYLLVSKKEMKRIADGTGWRIQRFFDDGKGMYVAVIEKEKDIKKA